MAQAKKPKINKPKSGIKRYTIQLDPLVADELEKQAKTDRRTISAEIEHVLAIAFQMS